jgi:hypothetical protein
MDWKLLVGGVVLAVIGSVILFCFRKSNFNRELGAGCLMSTGAIMLMIGVIAAGLSFMMRVA